MYRIVFALLSILVLSVSISPVPAAAGEYYDGGDYRSYERPSHRDHSRYRRVVSDDRDYNDRPYYSSESHHGSRSNYYEGSYSDTTRDTYHRPYYSTRNYDRPYRSSNYYGTSYTGQTIAYGNQPRHFYPRGCRPSRYKIYDDGGGWVWGNTSVCN